MNDITKFICSSFDMKEVTYKHGEECSRNCSRHIVTRCEKCGRYAAQGEATILEPREETEDEVRRGG